MSGDVHVRFCDRLGVEFSRATHLVILVSRNRDHAEHEKAELTNHLRPKYGAGAIGREDPNLRPGQKLRVPWSSGAP
jgi:hypothetical protein